MVQKQNVEDVAAGFSPGPIIRYIAFLYSTIEKVMLEFAQNVLDAKAGTADIVIDLTKMRMSCYDDGNGTSKEEMKEQIQKIGSSIKTKEDIGEKGIGKLAPLGIANGKWVFISKPKAKSPGEGFFRIELDQKDLFGQLVVPFEFADVPNFKFEEGGWTTCISMSGLQKSAIRGLTSQQNPATYLCDVIATAFSSRIKQVGTDISVKVVSDKGTETAKVPPQDYPGRHELVEIQTSKGPVTFEVYLTNSKQKKPQILIDHQGKLRFSLRNLADLWKDVENTLDCGYIQGIIHESFCTVSPDRQNLEWDDKLDVFIQAVTKFVEESVKPWLKAIEEERKDELFEEVGLEVIKLIENEILKENPGLLAEIFKGAVSTGHVHTKDKTETTTKIRTMVRRSRREGQVPAMPGSKRAKEKKGVKHGGVESLTGTVRIPLVGQSGLQILKDYNGLPNGYRIKLGMEGEEKGKVVINVRHQDWTETEKRKKAALMTYMKLLVTALMASALMPAPRNEVFLKEFEDVFFQYRKVLEPKIQ